MLCNSFDVLNANIAAVQSRAMLVRFEPSPGEIVARIKSFATDHEVLSFLERFQKCLPRLSLRTYGHLASMKQAGLPWQRYALEESNLPPKVLEIAGLLTRFDTDLDRLQHYSGSRRDYYNWKPQAVEHAERQARLSALQQGDAGDGAERCSA